MIPRGLLANSAKHGEAYRALRREDTYELLSKGLLVVMLLSVCVMAEVSSVITSSKPSLAPQKPKVLTPRVVGFDVFGTNRITPEVLRQTFGAEIDQWIKLGLSANSKVIEFEKKLTVAIQKKYELAFAQWTVVQHVEPDAINVFITLDVVEQDDASKRLSFRRISNLTLPDPEGLIANWDEYQKIALGLVQNGEIRLDSQECDALHCPFGHKHPKLQKYQSLFKKGAKKHFGELVEVLNTDSRFEHRANAVFLLAYSDDAKKVAELLVPAISDPHELVRNNVLRVLGDIAEFKPEVVIPIRQVAAALEYPRVSDRSKAINVVYFLAMGSTHVRQYLLENTVDTLVKLISVSQPDLHFASHAILRKISGKNFPPDDIPSWTQWSKKMTRDIRVPAERP